MSNVIGVKITGDGTELQRVLETSGRQVEGFGRKVQDTRGPLESLAQGLRSAFIRSSVAVGLITLKNLLGGATEAMVQAQIQVDQLRNGLNFAVGREKSAGELLFIRQAAQELGLEFVTTAQQYTKLAAAARGTTLEGARTREIFTAVAAASTVMGLSAEQTQGALLAITQIISKGKVQAEELRGQLGERLPGAFQIAARAMNVTTGELDKMLETGQVLATDFLPKFARQLSQEVAPEVVAASQSMQASINRLGNAWTDFKQTIVAGGTGEALANEVRGLSNYMQALRDQMDRVQESGGGIVKQFSAGLGFTLARAPFDALAFSANTLNAGLNAVSFGTLKLRTDLNLLPSVFQTNAQRAQAMGEELKRAEERMAALQAVSAKNPGDLYLTTQIQLLQTYIGQIKDANAAKNRLVNSGINEVARPNGEAREAFAALRASDRAKIDKLRQTNSGQSASFQSDLRDLAAARERGAFSTEQEYVDLVTNLINKEGGIKKEGGGAGGLSKRDVAQRLVELRQQATAAEQELSYSRERVGIERQLAALKVDEADGQPREYIAYQRAQLQNKELDAQKRGLDVELAAARAAELSAKREDDKIQAQTKRLVIERKLEELGIRRLQIDDGSADALARQTREAAEAQTMLARLNQERRAAGIKQGEELAGNARDSRISALPNSERARAMLEVEAEAMRKIIDVNYATEEQAREVWNQYFDWYAQRASDLGEQFASGPMAGIQAYLRDVADVGKQTADLFNTSMSAMSGALHGFLNTGKLGIKDFANTVLSSVNKILADQATASIGKSLMGGMSSGSGIGGWLGNFVGNLFGGGGGGGFGSGLAWSFPKAAGGWAPPMSIQEINELGPETLRMGQKQYLMMGKDGGQVVPTGGGGRTVHQSNHFHVSGPLDRRTQQQTALKVGMAAQNAIRRGA